VDERAVITGHRSQREDKLSGKSGTMESPVSTVRLRPKSYMFVLPAALPEFAQSHDRVLYSSHPLLPPVFFPILPLTAYVDSKLRIHFAYWVNTPK
jgi:hypothetical protein